MAELFTGALITNKSHDFVGRMLLRSKCRLDKLAGKAEEEEAKIRGLTEIRQNWLTRCHVQTPFPGGNCRAQNDQLAKLSVLEKSY